ncbi:hypothetical protein LCGC14_1902450 [marine sediment metagenome]|uniref:Uncharacterized protein n=1 Tax=marine sediment metagenome TaxID=412755 RepID=A0A0F9GJH8_9ZZZZ|nr:hypothetical protein [Desulfobacterales bacterium]
MKRQLPKTIDTNDPEYAAKKAETDEAIIKKARTDILSMLQKLTLKIIPGSFELEFVDDTEYPKFIKLDSKGHPGIVVHSKEEEKQHKIWVDPEKEKRRKAEAKVATKANKGPAFGMVTDGDGKDGTAGDK